MSSLLAIILVFTDLTGQVPVSRLIQFSAKVGWALPQSITIKICCLNCVPQEIFAFSLLVAAVPFFSTLSG
ncbi:unnamed protein product [Ixodes persulcatus]